MKAFKFFPFFVGLMLVTLTASCTDNDTDAIKIGDNTDSKGIDDTEKYDSRFPFPVWTDANGIMHFDIKLDDEGVYPSEDVVMNNLAGKGWELDKNYDYVVEEAIAPGKWKYQLKESDNLLFLVGGDPNPRFFFRDMASITMYYRWWYDPDEDGKIKDDLTHYSNTTEAFSYNEKTGILNAPILNWFRVIKSTETELWLGLGKDEEPYDYHFARYVRVSPETVANWEATYIE